MAIDRCAYPDALAILAGFGGAVVPIQPRHVREAVGSFMLPKEATADYPPPHHRYLVGRGFDPDYIHQHYQVMSCYTTGQYRHRIIAPIFIDGVMVNFIARDITGLSERKYTMAPNTDAIRPGEDVLYNIDRAQRSVAIVEGIFDVWRIGDGAVGLLGTALTEEKLLLLLQRGIERAFVIYDQDASSRAKEVANRVSKLIPHTENIWLPRGDPDTYFAENPSDLTDLQFLLR